MYQDLTTEEVEEAVENKKRLFVKIHVFTGEDVAANKIVGLINSLEEKESDIDVIVFSTNALVHTRIATDSTGKRGKMLERFLFGLHLDYLPYSDVIISIPKTDENEEELKKLCLKFGVEF